jgi:predicted DNA-binding transcriptional regulator AlpA
MSQSIQPWSVYEGRLREGSAGRISLQKAFALFLEDRIGFDANELPEIFSAPADDGENDAARDLVGLQAEWLVDAFASGAIATFVRPIQGGEICALPAWIWEIDDPLVRFSTASLDLENWADPHSAPTHRIFLDEKQFIEWARDLLPPETFGDDQVDTLSNPFGRAVLAVSQAAPLPISDSTSQSADHARATTSLGVGPKMLSLKQICDKAGIGRSTIYNRIRAGTFPEQAKLGERSLWSEAEIDQWLAEQLTKRTS